MGPSLRERRIAAIVGALVADAAAQPLHWNYDVNKLDGILEGCDDVAFWTPSINPFYTIDVGKQSCYGDQSYVVLRSLVEDKGVNIERMVKRTYDFFGPESEYEEPVNKGDAGNSDDAGRSKYPVQRPWRHSSIRDFLQNVQEQKPVSGSEGDKQIDCLLRIVSVVALYAGHPEMLNKAEAVIRLTQNSDLCVAVGLAAARLLERYILNGPSDDAVDHVIGELSNPKRANDQNLDQSVVEFLQEVQGLKDQPHVPTARSIKIS